MENERLNAALEYVKVGIPVIPLHGIKPDGSCTCKNGPNCTSKGKHPIYSGWQNRGIADADEIQNWWRNNPHANVGIITGESSGWLVLDTDTKSQGFGTLQTLEMLHDTLPETVTAITGSGGQHRIFKYPDGLKVPNIAGFEKGLDTRSNGGLIVAPPSRHESGGSYKWADGLSPFNREPAEAPAWLVKLMMAGVNEHKKISNATNRSNARKSVPEGSRNSHLGIGTSVKKSI